MVDEKYLGIVVYVAPRYAALSPLYRAADNSWQPVTEGVNEFPNRGYVGWHDPPDSAVKDSLWQFSLTESVSYQQHDPKRDQFYTSPQPMPHRSLEVLDWRPEDGLLRLEDMRRELTETGFWLPFEPPPSLYLWLEDELLAGPVQLKPHGGKWLAWAGQDEVLRGYAIPQNIVAELCVQGHTRHFLQPHAATVKMPNAPGRIFDWSSNKTVMKRVLYWLRHKDAAYADSINLTEKVLDHTARLIRREHDGDEAKLRQHQLQRALSLIGTVTDNWEMAQLLIGDLLALPVVVEQLRTARKKEKERVRNRLVDQTARIDALREEETKLAAEHNEQIRLAEERLAQLANELEQGQAALAQQAQDSQAALEKAVAEQLAEVMRRPEQTLANIAIMRAALRPQATDNAPGPRLATEPLSIRWPWDEWEAAPRLSEDAETMRQRLAQEFAARGYSPFVARTLHTAGQARLLPVVTGAAGYEVLADYAASVAGGRLLWLPVGPQMLEPEDLLGRYERTLGRFAPSAHGLAELLRRAVATDDLYVVVLDGVNRAPVDAYLMPLLALYADAEQPPERRRTWPLTPGGERLAWPPNVLLAGIWAEGASALPPSAAFWEAVAVLWAEQTPETVAAPDIVATPRASVSWQVWRTEQTRNRWDEARQALAEWLLGDALCSRQRAVKLATFYASLRDWGATDNEARRDLALACLAPDWLAKGDAKDLPESLSSLLETEEAAARWRILRWLFV